jgi:hypothetical protein
MQAELSSATDAALGGTPAANEPGTEELDLSLYAVPDTSPPPATPEPAPAVNWEEEAKKSDQRWRTLQGLYDRERAQREQLEQQLNNPLPPIAPPAVDALDDFFPGQFDENDPELDFTEDEQRIYSESLGVIQKAAKREAMKLVKTAVEPLTREIKQLRGASQKFEDMTERSFVAAVKSRVPDMDNVTANPNWKEYTAKRVPYTQLNIGQALMQAHQARDIDRIVEIFDGFVTGNTSNAVAALTAPAVAGAAPIPRQPGAARPKLKWSERQKAHDAFIKGNITHEKLRQIDAAYKQADAESRIDYNS